MSYHENLSSGRESGRPDDAAARVNHGALSSLHRELHSMWGRQSAGKPGDVPVPAAKDGAGTSSPDAGGQGSPLNRASQVFDGGSNQGLPQVQFYDGASGQKGPAEAVQQGDAGKVGRPSAGARGGAQSDAPISGDSGAQVAAAISPDGALAVTGSAAGNDDPGSNGSADAGRDDGAYGAEPADNPAQFGKGGLKALGDAVGRAGRVAFLVAKAVSVGQGFQDSVMTHEAQPVSAHVQMQQAPSSIYSDAGHELPGGRGYLRIGSPDSAQSAAAHELGAARHGAHGRAAQGSGADELAAQELGAHELGAPGGGASRLDTVASAGAQHPGLHDQSPGGHGVVSGRFAGPFQPALRADNASMTLSEGGHQLAAVGDSPLAHGQEQQSVSSKIQASGHFVNFHSVSAHDSPGHSDSGHSDPSDPSDHSDHSGHSDEHHDDPEDEEKSEEEKNEQLLKLVKKIREKTGEGNDDGADSNEEGVDPASPLAASQSLENAFRQFSALGMNGLPSFELYDSAQSPGADDA